MNDMKRVKEALDAIVNWCADVSTMPIGDRGKITWYRNRIDNIMRSAKLARLELEKGELNESE